MKKVHSSIHLVLSFIVTCAIITLWTPRTVQAQGVGIGTVTPDTSAILDLTSDTTGFLVPRMTLTQRDAINTPATGLLVFVTTDSMFHYFDGAAWLPIDGRTRMLVDADGDTRIQIEETPDDDKIRFKMAGTEFFRMANGRLEVLNSGRSVFIGHKAGATDDKSNNENVAIGDSASFTSLYGSSNVAVGFKALFANGIGANNTAIGHEALKNNIAYENTAVGYHSLWKNSSGYYNTAVGSRAMIENTGGDQNTAIGYYALSSMSNGSNNTSVGYQSTYLGTGGDNNTVLGHQALYDSDTASDNVVIGHRAGQGATGNGNVMIGFETGLSAQGAKNVLLGYQSGYHADGQKNVFIGHKSGYNETNSNRLYIENSDADSTNALIYGEFDNNLLRVNGRLIASMGLSDADGDTKIEMEQTPDDDTIRFNMGGTEFFKMANGRLGVVNTGGSVFMGLGAGASDDLTDNMNVAVGDSALLSNTTGSNNTAYGKEALKNNETGAQNLALGYKAGYSSIGDNNIYIGHQAGYNETGSNRLYIQNTSAPADSSLIYGEFDSDILALNASVGIGTITPEYKLHVLGQSLIRDTSRATLMLQTSSNSKDMGLAFRRSGANYEWNIFREGATSDLVFTGGNESDINALTEIIRMTSGGKVGIGTSLPEERLHVSGGNAIIDRGPATASINRKLTIGGAKNTSNGAYATIQFNNYDSNDESIDYTGASIASTNATGNQSGDLRFYTAETDSVAKERMIISPLGRVGIGTSSPSVSLNVSNGDVRIDRGSETSTITRTLTINGAYASGASPFAQLNFENYDSNDGAANYIAASIQSENSNMHAAGNLTFWTNPGGTALTQQMTITEEGAVGIGTTSPDTRFEVTEANVSGAVATIENTTNNSNGIGLIIKAGTIVNPTNQFIRFKDGDGTNIGSIAGNGSGGVVYNTTSDRRLKNSIRTFDAGLPLLMKIRPTIYQRNTKPGVDEIGFIAQEMYDVFPQIVSGTPDQPVENPMMVDYGRLTPVLVAAIQEQQHTIEQQQELIESYRAQIDALTEAQSNQQAQLDTLSAMVKSMVEMTASNEPQK